MNRRCSISPVPFLLSLLLAALVPPLGLAAGGTIEDFRRLALADRGYPMTAQAGAVEHLELEFVSGTLTPIVTPAGERLGLFFEGEGKLLVRITDPQALGTFQANARVADSRITVGPDNVRETFERLVILSSFPVLEALTTGEATVPTADAGRKALEKMLAGMDRSDTGFDHLAAEARFNETGGRYAYAECEGGRVRLGYSFDAARFNSESLVTFVQPPGFDFRFRRLISWQSVGRRVPLAFRLEHATFAIDTPDNRRGTIDSKLTLAITADGVRVLAFALINNRDPKSEAWAAEGNRLVVRRVTDEAGRELPFSHRYHELIVDLGSPRKTGSKVDLTVETEGEIFSGPGGYRDDNYLDLYSIDWYPAPLSSAGRRFTFDLAMRTKKPFRPVTSGDTLSLEEEGDHFLLKARSEVPVWDVAVFAGKYKVKETDAAGRKVRAYAYAMGRDKDIEQVASLSASFLQLYEKMLGPYPFGELEVVEVPSFSFYGISPPGVVILTSRSFQPQSEVVRTYLGNKGVNALVAHELAHQWFGHKAWPEYPNEDNWLTESLAEYASGLAMGVAVQASGADTTRILDFKEMLGGWRTYAAMAEDKASIAGANRIGGDLGPDYRYYLLYCRGPLVLHQLRTMIGDERYLSIMRRYLDEAKIGPVTTEDLARAASAVLGQEMDWYFDQWTEEPGTPEIKVDHRVERAPGGSGFELKVRLTQTPGSGFKKIHVPLVLDYGGGQMGVKLAFQEQPVQDFSFPLEREPARVLVDPGKNCLAKIR